MLEAWNDLTSFVHPSLMAEFWTLNFAIKNIYPVLLYKPFFAEICHNYSFMLTLLFGTTSTALNHLMPVSVGLVVAEGHKSKTWWILLPHSAHDHLVPSVLLPLPFGAKNQRWKCKEMGVQGSQEDLYGVQRRCLWWSSGGFWRVFEAYITKIPHFLAHHILLNKQFIILCSKRYPFSKQQVRLCDR